MKVAVSSLPLSKSADEKVGRIILNVGWETQEEAGCGRIGVGTGQRTISGEAARWLTEAIQPHL